MKIVDVLVTQFSLAISYVLSTGLKFYPQHLVIEHPNHMLFP